jgi:uncharacterized membrane protein
MTIDTSIDTFSEQASKYEALNILKLRYVNGEISKEQYEQMKKDLEEK